MNKRNFFLASFIVVVAASLRLIPQPPNFSPIGAIALFSGAIFISKVWKYILPIAILYFSDFMLNNGLLRTWFSESEGLVFFSQYMIPNYIAFVLAIIIGHLFIKKITVSRVLGGAISFSVVFFLISNFGVWLSTPTFTKDFAGLTSAYIAGWPFFQNTIAGNLVYCTILFGSYAAIKDILDKRAFVQGA